jgi:predicted membrane-bound spermidine synthase
MSLGMSDQNEFEPHPVRKIAYYLLDFVLFFSSSAIAFYFMGLAGVFSMVIFPGFTFLGILIAIFILNIVSLFMPLFNKRHQNLSTFITRILTKDTKEFEGPVDVIESIENNEGYGSRT